MKSKTHFAFRVDIWDDTGDSILEHVAGVEDFEVAEATYRAAVRASPCGRERAGCMTPGNNWRIDPSEGGRGVSPNRIWKAETFCSVGFP
jgi:hypothetical protein